MRQVASLTPFEMFAAMLKLFEIKPFGCIMPINPHIRYKMIKPTKTPFKPTARKSALVHVTPLGIKLTRAAKDFLG